VADKPVSPCEDFGISQPSFALWPIEIDDHRRIAEAPRGFEQLGKIRRGLHEDAQTVPLTDLERRAGRGNLREYRIDAAHAALPLSYVDTAHLARAAPDTPAIRAEPVPDIAFLSIRIVLVMR
jgi:hypothetical protein